MPGDDLGDHFYEEVEVSRPRRVRLVLSAVSAALALAMSGCSVGSIGGSDDSGSQTTISYLTTDDPAAVATNDALIKAFMAKNSDIIVKHDTRPGGTEGDNLVKTRLSTGEMADVFNYNSGSLFQAINPDTNLVPLDDQPWSKSLDKLFVPQVSTDKALYGAPLGSSSGGGVLYNRKVYDRLGLKVPTSWAEFVANNKKIAEDDGDVTPIEQTYGDTWTSQLFVLADFANVAAQDPKWAEEYTRHHRKYAEQPGLQSFLNQAEMAKKGYFNKDFASATYEKGVEAIATGNAGHYPMQTSAVSLIKQSNADHLDDVGFFALPARDAANTTATVWLPNGLYIPKTTTDDKLDAAKKFIDFVMSAEGCKIQIEKGSIAGPFSDNDCQVPSDVPPIVSDLQGYYDKDKTGPALEFISPIKGPNLENITVEVGSGIRSAKAGAALYDKDVQKQAQQLGLPGW